MCIYIPSGVRGVGFRKVLRVPSGKIFFAGNLVSIIRGMRERGRDKRNQREWREVDEKEGDVQRYRQPGGS